MTVDEALQLFPESSDIMVEYNAGGRAQLEAAIQAFEDALGVTPSFDDTDEDTYRALLIAPEEKRHDFIAAVNQETDIAALYWTYANWTRKDEFDKLWAIARNDSPKLLALAERSLAVDKTYIAYGPYRCLAAFWRGLPPLPLTKFGQNLPRTLSYICPVIDAPEYCSDCADCPIDPDGNVYFENRLVFAQYYLMEKELWDEAARVLQSIIDDPIREVFPLYDALDQQLAIGLLDQVNQHR